MTKETAVTAAVPAGAKAAPISRVFGWEREERGDLYGGPLVSALLCGEIGEQGLDLLVGELVEVGQQKLLDGLADLGDGRQRLCGSLVKRRDGCSQSGDGRRLEEEAQG